ncbi:AMP-binding protein [Granulosicoccus antarcticus]|nr:AMP-binding protein [Granulosicoccus antarcticus]
MSNDEHESKDGRIPSEGLSQVTGPVSEPLLTLSIPALLQQTVALHGNRDAAVFVAQGIRWSYKEFSDRVDALAIGLLNLGLQAGDRVGIWSPNRVEWLLAQFASARIGLILVNINPAYRTSELEYSLNKVSCKALITAEQFKSSNYVDMLRELAPELDSCQAGELVSARLPALQIVIKVGDAAAGIYAFDDIAGGTGKATEAQLQQLDRLTASIDIDDAINIQFTSGTTGMPKGATLTHRNIVNNAHFVTRAIGLTENDRLCIPVPFYHCFGMVMGTLGCVSKGATMVVPTEGFEPLATLRVLSNEQCTAMYGVPTMFVAMLDHPELKDFEFKHLRTGIMAGSPCPVEVMKRVQSTLNMDQVTIAYGMTETSPVSFQSSVNDSLEKRVSSVGQVHPHVSVKIIDEDQNVVPVGTQGELCTRGYSVMQGYWEDAEQTQGSIDSQGWMHTGDLATLDAEGFCNITGRVKDMIVRGGENVYPREIEEYLYTMPGVTQVQVFGVPDEKYIEAVCAWIVCRNDADGQSITKESVTDFCKGKIAHYKIPSYVQVVEEIPMTVTGKAQKFIMRKRMVEKLELVEAKTA